MTLTTLGSDISIVWFWAGLFILLSMAHVYRNAVCGLRMVDRCRRDLVSALTERRSEISRIAPTDAGLARICRFAETATEAEELFACETDIDAWIYHRQKSERASAEDAAMKTTVLLETANAELQPHRDKYNEAVMRIRILRRSFPGAIIVRSVIDSDPCLLPDIGPM